MNASAPVSPTASAAPEPARLTIWQALWRLARYRFGLWLLSGILVSCLFYLLPLLPGLLIRQFFDQLTGTAPVGLDQWSLLALLVAIGLVRFISLSGAVVVEVTVNQLTAGLLWRNLLNYVLHQPGARSLPASPGEAISRFRDDVRIVVHFLTWTLDPLGQAMVFIIALTILVQIDPFLTFAVAIPLLVVFVVVNLANRRIEQLRHVNQAAIGTVTGLLGEIFGGVLAVKAASAEERVTAHFAVINAARRRAALNDLLLTQFLSSVGYNAANIGTGLLLLAAARAIHDGRFSVGDFALFASYITWLAQVTAMTGEFLTKYRQAGVSFERLWQLLPAAPPATLVAHAPLEPLPLQAAAGQGQRPPDEPLEELVVTGLTYHYPDSEGGITGIDLRLRRGSVTVITGQIGAGKTTLLRVLLGLLPAEAGSIVWNGRVVDDPASFFVPPRSAYTPQAPRLFSETLGDNILMGLSVEPTDLAAALRAAVLEEDLAGLPGGLATPIGSRGVRLSGGQLQRTAAARMLVRRPELLVVDDLSSALDAETEQLLWQRLAEWPETTVLAVSHRRAALRRADQILVMVDGRIAARGTLAELSARETSPGLILEDR